MKQLEHELRPTIWRTVRAAMNPIRLNIMKLVLFSKKREFCVSDIARRFNIDQPIATIYLRQLNARGLLGVERGRIKVFYNGHQDRSLPDSVAFQDTLRQCLAGRLSKGWEAELITIMKAFTHFNRLAIITRLAEGPAEITDLTQAVGGCVKSIYHHLRILYSADLLTGHTSSKKPTIFHLKAPVHPLSRTLLKLTLLNKDRFAKYWNAPIGDENDPATQRVLANLRKAENLTGYAPWKVRKPATGKSRPLSRKTKSARTGSAS